MYGVTVEVVNHEKNPKYFSIYPELHQRISEFVTPHFLTLFLVSVLSCLDYVGWRVH